MRTIDYEGALRAARGLMSEDAENPEYDRALFELIARMFPFTYDTQQDADAAKAHLLELED